MRRSLSPSELDRLLALMGRSVLASKLGLSDASLRALRRKRASIDLPATQGAWLLLAALDRAGELDFSTAERSERWKARLSKAGGSPIYKIEIAQPFETADA